MMIKYLVLISALVGWVTANAQVREVLFNSFPADSVTSIKFNMQDSTVIHGWHNSAIFIETEVTMSGCPESLLKHAVGQGRYIVETLREGQKITLKHQHNRPQINYPRGSCTEVVVHRIYLPGDFKMVDPTEWKRSDELSKSTLNY